MIGDEAAPRERFDTIVVGAGPAGEVVADELAAGGQKVVVVERERVAGEWDTCRRCEERQDRRSFRGWSTRRRLDGSGDARRAVAH
ncbi:MAG: FAD-dependent monooxygenase [Solirubrobacterales bacterium]|nr:FAD-dependent monooxygenase [Solirubrobacterales bacterium]